MNECIPVEQLGTLKQLSDDDPRRRHAASCPRCSSLLFAYEAFIHSDAAEGADPVAAEMQLERFIATNVEQKEPEQVSGTPRPSRGRWFDFSLVRVAAVAAAVILVAVLVWQPWQSKSIVYRGEQKVQFSGLSATRAADGSVDLRWDAVKNADAYRVTILAQDLGEITRLESGGVLSAHLASGMSGAPAPYYWQVTALADGAEILTSDPQRLP
jgi:hypothetical protein